MLEQDEKKKTKRLEARLTPEVHALLQHAASLQGCSVSDFVVTAAQEAAGKVIEQREIIRISKADQERFAEALLDPAAPRRSMKRAAAAHRNLIQPP